MCCYSKLSLRSADLYVVHKQKLGPRNLNLSSDLPPVTLFLFPLTGPSLYYNVSHTFVRSEDANCVIDIKSYVTVF